MGHYSAANPKFLSDKIMAACLIYSKNYKRSQIKIAKKLPVSFACLPICPHVLENRLTDFHEITITTMYLFLII
jgi:hypothetical protein